MLKLRQVGLLRPILPDDDITPWSIGLIVLWATVLPILLCYFMFLPFASMTGEAPWEFASMILDESLSALSPLLVVLLGHWVLYAYGYFVAVPVVMSLEHGRTLAYGGFYALTALLKGVRCEVVMWWRDLVTGRRHRKAAATSPLRLISRQGMPAHLATGWSPATHPQLVYH